MKSTQKCACANYISSAKISPVPEMCCDTYNEANQVLMKEKEYWKKQAFDLREALSYVRQQFTDSSKESDAAFKLLRIHIYHLQAELLSKRQEKDIQSDEFGREKYLLLQQNDQLQEQLKYFLEREQNASAVIEVLTASAQENPRLRLLRKVNKVSG